MIIGENRGVLSGFSSTNAHISVNSEDGPADTIGLRGTLSSREFLGSSISYMVDIRGDRVFADVQHQQGRSLIELGTDVGLHIQQDQIMIVNA